MIELTNGDLVLEEIEVACCEILIIINCFCAWSIFESHTRIETLNFEISQGSLQYVLAFTSEHVRCLLIIYLALIIRQLLQKKYSLLKEIIKDETHFLGILKDFLDNRTLNSFCLAIV